MFRPPLPLLVGSLLFIALITALGWRASVNANSRLQEQVGVLEARPQYPNLDSARTRLASLYYAHHGDTGSDPEELRNSDPWREGWTDLNAIETELVTAIIRDTYYDGGWWVAPDEETPEEPEPEPEPPPCPGLTRGGGLPISAERWDDCGGEGEWPFTVESGFLTCYDQGMAFNTWRRAVFFLDNRDIEMWPVNGTAIGSANQYGAKESIDPILREGRRGTLQWMIQRGMDLCGNR